MRVRTLGAALTASALLWGLGQLPASGNHGTVTAVKGSAYGYFTRISLFGGPFGDRGPNPTVTLPASGGNLSATDPDGDIAQYGPAVLFQSGPMTVTATGSLGATGSSGSTTDITGYQDTVDTNPDGDGPGPFLFNRVRSTCAADQAGKSGTTTIDLGVLETKYDPATQEPTVTETIPVNPVPNYTRTGTIDHVGDSYRIVFNEQVLNADGSLTVNAAHMYLLGPTAIGDLIIGQSVCGVTAQPGPNAAPVAFDDSYSTGFNTPLTVAAPGVLANDTDADGGPRSAGSASDPPKGGVTLNADGSFTYTPDANTSGNDTFTYTVTDDHGATDTGLVTVAVAGPPAADVGVVVTSPATATVNTTFAFTATVTNHGPGTALGVVDTPTLNGVTLVSATWPGGSCGYVGKGKSKVLTCALGTMAPTQVIAITFTVQAPRKPGLVAVTALMSSTTTDNNGGNNSSSSSTNVVR